jgi:hypothetical protein
MLPPSDAGHPDVGGRSGGGSSAAQGSELDRDIVSRLGGGVADAYLKRRKTAAQFDCAVLGTFLGAELGLKATIDFERETVFGQFNRSDGHSESVIVGNVPHLVKVSPATPTSPFW